jgi:hypothetical protein
MRRWPFVALIAWTVFVWIGRIRNGGAFVLAAAFLLLAALAAWRRGRWTTALVAVTIGFWLIRAPMILAADHPGGFKVVHTVLAVVSIALAVSVQRDVQREREAPTPAARL